MYRLVGNTESFTFPLVSIRQEATNIAHENKVALVTGSNRGIGFETARQLGKQGATVVVSARTEHDAALVHGSYVKKVSRLILLLSM